jgi:H+/Cl- antiporter ClcA
MQPVHLAAFVIAWRIISLFGLWRGVLGGVVVPLVLMGLTIAATIHAKPATQGVALTIMGIFALVAAMTLLPRAQANLLRPTTRD